MDSNIVIQTFRQGGPVMWPILLTAIISVAVVLERIFWWTRERRRRDVKKRDAVLEQVEKGDIQAAANLARDSQDPILRMLWHGLTHHHSSLQGALQVAAGTEIERSGRFLAVLDTIVTLAPLLGLLGTVTGIMRSFNFVGNEDLAASKVGGGIAEALIATACGLTIAIFCLIPFNYFGRLVERLRFEMETAATNLELMLDKSRKP